MLDINAGTGTPYWYEWSVGLLYAVRMLNPDEGIESVVLQSSESQSLDDVVITYSNGNKEYIQVKHTRDKGILSFSDMIEGEEGKSYISKYSSDWKDLSEKQAGNCKVLLFTNRELGERKYTPKGEWQRPPLASFWDEIKRQLNDPKITCINDIVVKKEWEDAWKTWKSHMSKLDDSEKLDFIKRFDIVADQNNLMGVVTSIADELKKVFNTSEEKAIELHQKLCYRLIWWSTTIRKKEKIEKEDVMEALSLSGDEIVGNHVLPLCEPFFDSRIDFVCDLEKQILKGKSNITFLTGNPGAGKTNIISYLACKPKSIVTLRFHVFKPILANDLYLTADRGISDARDFWGSLLIMFRTLFKGKLYEYKVPISIELIASIEVLRSEVIRLADTWADISGSPTVIAVDGIDHAARSGNNNTFLSSLIPPEGLPENVKFILAGQPVYQFSEYPSFLADSERIELAEVPEIQKTDIELLYASNTMEYSEHDRRLIIDYILEIAQGNTLSAVFAMQEATRYSKFEDFETKSNTNILNAGIESYYEYIWRSTLELVKDIGFVISINIAGVFSIINRKVTSENFCEIFGESGIPKWQWEEILQNLFPIIDYNQYGYSIFHNDVRIFLTAHFKKANRLIPQIKGNIVDFLLKSDFDSSVKHEIIFQLLEDIGRKNEFVDVFSPEYVIEGFSLKRSTYELSEQMEKTLKTLVYIEDKKKIVSFSCAVTTMYQYKESLRWLDLEYQEEYEVPFALESERSTVPDEMMTIEVLEALLFDINLLVTKNEMTRATRLLERWLGGKSPLRLYNILDKAEGDDTEAIAKFFEDWGKLSRMLKVITHLSIQNYRNDNERRALANFIKGWLKQGERHTSIEDVKYTLDNTELFYKKDIEEYIEVIIRNASNDSVIYLLSVSLVEHFSNVNRISACVWCIKNNREDLCKEWIDKILEDRFTVISDDEHQDYHANEIRKKDFKTVYDLSYVLTSNNYKTFSQYKHEGLSKCGFKQGTIDYSVAANILNGVCFVAYAEKCIKSNQIQCIDIDDFKVLLGVFLDIKYFGGCFNINTMYYRKNVIQNVIRLAERLPVRFQEILNKELRKKVCIGDEVSLIDCCWEYLSQKGELSTIEEYYDKWMSLDGLLWKEELSDRVFRADLLISMARQLGWKEKAEEAEKLLQVRIGYVGRKDYSLFTPLNWISRTADINWDIWEREGLELMNISYYASEIGDNRATVQVLSSIASIASKAGLTSFYKFICIVKNVGSDWINLLTDGLISMMEHGKFSLEQLINIWRFGVNQYSIDETADRYDSNNTLKKIYISDIHEAISLCANRLDIGDIEETLKDISTKEFSQKRLNRSEHSFIIPHRWYEVNHNDRTDAFVNHVSELTLKELFTHIEEIYLDANQRFSWNFIAYFINKASKQNVHIISEYKDKIISMLNNRPIENSLEYDGSHEVYNDLFIYLDEDEIEGVLKRINDTYFHNKKNGWMSTEFGLMTDLEHFSYALFSRYTEQENIDAIRKILQMHKVWLNGSKKKVLENRYVLCNSNYEINELLDLLRILTR